MPAGSMSFPAFCQESKRSPPRLQTVFFPGFPYPHTEKREKKQKILFAFQIKALSLQPEIDHYTFLCYHNIVKNNNNKKVYTEMKKGNSS